MANYVLSRPAQEDLVAIRDYYLEAGGAALARRMLREFIETFRWLSDHPQAGHPRKDLAGNRDVLFWGRRSYPVVYRDAAPLEIVMVVHAARDVESLLTDRPD